MTDKTRVLQFVKSRFPGSVNSYDLTRWAIMNGMTGESAARLARYLVKDGKKIDFRELNNGWIENEKFGKFVRFKYKIKEPISREEEIKQLVLKAL